MAVVTAVVLHIGLSRRRCWHAPVWPAQVDDVFQATQQAGIVWAAINGHRVAAARHKIVHVFALQHRPAPFALDFIAPPFGLGHPVPPGAVSAWRTKNDRGTPSTPACRDHTYCAARNTVPAARLVARGPRMTRRTQHDTTRHDTAQHDQKSRKQQRVFLVGPVRAVRCAHLHNYISTTTSPAVGCIQEGLATGRIGHSSSSVESEAAAGTTWACWCLTASRRICSSCRPVASKLVVLTSLSTLRIVTCASKCCCICAPL